MRLLKAAAALLCAAGLAASAQMTPVTATKLQMSGASIASGTVTFIPVDNIGSPVTVVTADGSLQAQTSTGEQGFTAEIANGVIDAEFSVPDQLLSVSTSVPSIPIGYRVVIVDLIHRRTSTLLIPASNPVVSGSTAFALDHYAPAQSATISPAGLISSSTMPAHCTAPSIWYPSTSSTSLGVCQAGVFNVISIGSSGGSGGSTPGAATPTFTAGGTFSSSQLLSFADSTPGSLIYFTSSTSGTPSDPTAASTLFTSAVSVTTSATYKAIAVANGYLNSAVATVAFAINSGNADVAITALTLGADQPFNGYLPFLSTDILRRNVTNAPVSALNVGFQLNHGTAHMDSDEAMVINVVNSSTQNVVWYPVTPMGSGYPVMVPLVGNELLEAQTSTITPFTCWASSDSGDHHLLVIDIGTRFAYEFYRFQICNGRGMPYSAKVWKLDASQDNQNFLGSDSVDAAGLAVTSGILRYDEVASGVVNHAIRFSGQFPSRVFTVNGTTFCGVVEPATHYSRDQCGGNPATTPQGLPYGARIRLKSSFDISTFPPEIQVILTAYKTYGIFFADTGGGNYTQLEADDRWDIDHLATIKTIPLSNYEMVDVGSTGMRSVDTTDDPNGSDSVVYSYSQTQTGPGAYAVAYAVTPNPYSRPTITSASASASSVVVGTPVTLSLTDTNSTLHWFDNAPSFQGNSVIVIPSQTTTFTPYSQGRYGIRIGTPFTVTVTGPQVATPKSSLASATFTTPQTFTLADDTAASLYYYTQDGSTPTNGSTPYTGSVNIATSQTLKVIAYKSAMIPSGIATYNYVFNLPAASAPTFSPGGGTMSTGAQTVTVATSTPNPSIFITTDGTTPTTASGRYTGPITVSAAPGVQQVMTINALVVAYGYSDAISSSTYTVGTQTALNGTVPSGDTYVVGKFSQAVSPGAGNDHQIVLPAGFSGLNTPSGYTFGAWLQTTSKSGYQVAGAIRLSSIFLGTVNGQFIVSAGTGGLDSALRTGLSINDGAFHYCKVVIDATGLHSFVDGVAGATGSVSAYPINSPANINGLDDAGRYSWMGAIDEFFVENFADYSTTVPTAPFTGSETGMFALYHLDGNALDSTVR